MVRHARMRGQINLELDYGETMKVTAGVATFVTALIRLLRMLVRDGGFGWGLRLPSDPLFSVYPIGERIRADAPT